MPGENAAPCGAALEDLYLYYFSTEARGIRMGLFLAEQKKLCRHFQNQYLFCFWSSDLVALFTYYGSGFNWNGLYAICCKELVKTDEGLTAAWQKNTRYYGCWKTKPEIGEVSIMR